MDYVSLFSGCGGADCGLMQAGLKSRLHVEWNIDCRRSLKRNDPDCPIDDANLFDLSVGTVLQRNGLGADFGGLIWLSPPCQGLSESGKKLGWDDPRNELLFTVAEACRYAPQAWIVMEQVRGVRMGNAKPLWEELLFQIEETGRESCPWLLHAVHFGLAQTRKRIFLICPPQGHPMPEMPHGDWELFQPPTLFDAIHPTTGFVDKYPKIIELSDNEQWLREGIPAGGNWRDTFRGREYVFGYWKRKVRRIRAEGKVIASRPRPPMPRHLARLAWDKPTGTVMACWPSHMGSHVGMVHPDLPRHLTNGELFALQGFPPEWIIKAKGYDETIKDKDGKDKVVKISAQRSRRRQIGNAVPPIFAQVVAESILKCIKTHGK